MSLRDEFDKWYEQDATLRRVDSAWEAYQSATERALRIVREIRERDGLILIRKEAYEEIERRFKNGDACHDSIPTRNVEPDDSFELSYDELDAILGRY